MHEETLKTNSTMVAVLKMPNDKLEELCKEFEGVYPVNYNGPGQTVVALAASLKEGFCEAVRANGGRAMPLPVSAAFHSPYLDGAAVRLAETLKETEVKIPALPVYANLSARPYSTDVEGVKRTIAEQANHPVYWQKTIENMVADGIDTFVEVGAGKTLSNLIKKIAPQVQIYNVEDAQSLVETVAAIKAN
jgi:[acyl-carrier-protein] S-malonyltransferase